MRSDEVAIAEAGASLTARLESWGVEDAGQKAHQFVTDMLRNGWRPRARAIETPTYRAQRTPPPADLIAAMRADIAAAKYDEPDAEASA
jgi:hypothetical protein